jgi:hypothetical protein
MKHGPDAISEFSSAVYSQFGMRIVVLAAFLDTRGEPSISM